SEDFEDAAGFGWTVGERSFSWPALIAAKDKEIDRLNQVYLKLLSISAVVLFPEHASFIDNHRVQIGERLVSAERILIATGAHPWFPEIPGIEHAISSDEAFYLPQLPERVVVVGGGYIACEFAGIFNGLGSSVTQIYRGDTVLRGFDHDVRRALSAEMAAKGVNFAFGCNVAAISQQHGELHCELEDGKILHADQVMYATGRVPNVRNLGLENTAVEVHANGWIVVDEYSRTSVPHIWAVGDVTNRVNLTPVAIFEGHAFADTEFGGRDRPVSHEFIPSAVFSQPPVGTVGYGEHDARSHYGDLDIYRAEFRPLKHTLTGRAEKSMMKLIVARTSQKVVGLHMVGADAPEIVQGFAVAVKSGLTKEQFDATIGIHPTAAE
ncbi:MAG TPA: FAD-dependent oxidoreductase, partial [Xanthomonadales bacterium]|nr:FAD-dependent oxidoreductase [Xanthomonadales bacterium]